MKLEVLLNNIEYKLVQGNMAQDVNGICNDSRKYKPLDLFIAVKGFESDGHAYIKSVIDKGCKVLVVEELPGDLDQDICVVQVEDSRKTMGLIAANYYDHPTSKFNLVGITGTNGKTSITFFIQAILKALKASVGIVGTIGVWTNDHHIKTNNTTPESLDLQGYCAGMVDQAVDYCMMEVSSHALALNRVAGCEFDAGIFTNLSPDHLELHGTMEDYFEAKALLFNMTQTNIINGDDAHGRLLIERHPHNTISYGLSDESTIYPSQIKESIEGSTYILHTPKGSVPVRVALPGDIYIYNSLAAAAWAFGEGISLDIIGQGLSSLRTIKGRFETVYQQDDLRVIVDFSHTEDSLKKALDTLRPYVKNQLKVLFGVYAAPGDLGLDKRQGMARAAAKHADLSYITSDNPKKQDPRSIIRDICQEMDRIGGQYQAKVDRKEAIELALSEMEAGDVLLIAGKGHETSQVIGNEEIPFCEREIVNTYMALKNQ